MKAYLSLLFFLFVSVTAAFSQGINYQAVARDADGEILANQPLTVSFTIYEGGSNTPAYEESHQVTTDDFGQFTLIIGEGAALEGDFEGIDWTAGPHEIGLELDSGSGPVDLGRLPLQGVPYSFFAERAGSVTMQVSDLTDVSDASPSEGQVLKWNGSEWVPSDDQDSDNQTLTVNGNQLSIEGGNTVNLPTGEGGDNWGSQTVNTGEALDGSGTLDDPLTLARQNAVDGQVLKWNGSEWVPGEDKTGPSYSAGAGISLENNEIQNTGDIDAGDDITTSSLAGGDVSGPFNNLTVTGLSGRAVADFSPNNAQVLAWNGARDWWQPATINFPSYQAGQGIFINNNTIFNTGDLDPDDDLLKTTVAGGDVAGTFNNLAVLGLRGRPLANQIPVPGQFLKWNGQAWVPDSVRVGSSSVWSNNNNKIFYNNGFVGIGTNNPLSKLHLFGGDLLIQDNFPVLTLNGSGANKIISFQINGQDQGSLFYSNGIGLRGWAGGDINVNSWVLSPDGNFGLGLNNPQRKLHVHFDNNNGITSQMLISQAGGGDAWLNFGLDGGAHYAVGIDNSDGDKFKIGYNSTQARGVGDNTRLTINNVGYVGIGTTNPSVPLDVNGALKIRTTTIAEEGIIRYTGSDFQGRKGNQWVSLTEGGSLWSQTSNNLFYTDGRVGIGTETPSRLLTLSRLNQTAQHQLELRNVSNITNGNFDGIIFTQGITGSTRLASIQVNYRSNGQPDMSLNLRNDNNLVYLEAGGNVGINTSNPGDNLDVNGNIRTNSEVRSTRTGAANLIPIAYGNISSNGSINQGTGNFSVNRTGAGTYEITISGESIFFEDYIISTNLAGDAGFATYSSIGGKLLIKTFNLIGVVLAADRSFSFVVYKP